jgi:hypothetical protein
MTSVSSLFDAPPVVGAIPAVPGLPLLGNLLAFRRDRLALHDAAARLGPISRVSIGHIPLYIVTDGDLALEVLVAQAAVNIRGIQRRPDYYPEPLAFHPERMLPDAKKARPRYHYLPFGAGPRVCIGAHFALMETQLALATMVQEARLKPLTTSAIAEPLVTLRPRGGMPTLVERC